MLFSDHPDFRATDKLSKISSTIIDKKSSDFLDTQPTPERGPRPIAETEMIFGLLVACSI